MLLRVSYISNTINIDSVTEKEYVWYGTAGPQGADCFRDNPSEGESTI
jgi:hypothetical protein